MGLGKKVREMVKERKWAVFMTVCGVTGMLLIMISSLVPDRDNINESQAAENHIKVEDYSLTLERRLSDFLCKIDGAGEVRVYISIGSSERYVYATEGRQSRSDNKSDEEEKYVIIGSGSERNALIETVENPKITGAVVLCSGGDSSVVCERIYNAVSAVLNLPIGRIYVSKLR